MPEQKWTFKSRIRPKAYGPESAAQAVKRLKEAVSEIQEAAKVDPITAADGAVCLIERICPALERVDSSSRAVHDAVDATINALIPIVIDAPADVKSRSEWSTRLLKAVQHDTNNQLARLTDRWGAICGKELASEWAERLLPVVSEAFSSGEVGSWFWQGRLCLSCLVAAEHYEELDSLLTRVRNYWPFIKFRANALVQQGRVDEAIGLVESCRGRNRSHEEAVLAYCEQALLDAGRAEESYKRYALRREPARTNTATFRQIANRHPDRDPHKILLDLIEANDTKGKWFAAAKDAGCLDLAIDCAHDSNADAATLLRAARDFVDKEPNFAAQVGICAIANFLDGFCYKPTTSDVILAYQYAISAAAKCGRLDWTHAEVDRLIAKGAASDRREILHVLIAERRLLS